MTKFVGNRNRSNLRNGLVNGNRTSKNSTPTGSDLLTTLKDEKTSGPPDTKDESIQNSASAGQNLTAIGPDHLTTTNDENSTDPLVTNDENFTGSGSEPLNTLKPSTP